MLKMTLRNHENEKKNICIMDSEWMVVDMEDAFFSKRPYKLYQ